MKLKFERNCKKKKKLKHIKKKNFKYSIKPILQLFNQKIDAFIMSEGYERDFRLTGDASWKVMIIIKKIISDPMKLYG